MIRAVKGTRDLLPPATAVWNHVESVARGVFHAYNYREIRTPILEETQLFARGVGEETDIVTKEMYTFTDRDDTSLTLRPENTASVIRAYIEHRLGREAQIMARLKEGPQTIPQMVAKNYADTPVHLHPAAGRSMLAHLIQMVKDGRVKTDDGRATIDSTYRL